MCTQRKQGLVMHGTITEIMPPGVRLVAEIFRKLAVFRKDYDGAVLQELAATLRRHMGEHQADKVMSDALVMDNEIRFRRPAGLILWPAGGKLAGAQEEALLALIRHADAAHDILAVAAAEELGIENHRVLRKCASLLARSLAQGGVDLGWGVAQTAMQIARGLPLSGSSQADMRL
jgi:hypothetical protein